MRFYPKHNLTGWLRCALIVLSTTISGTAQTAPPSRATNAQRLADAAAAVQAGDLSRATTLLQQILAADARNANAHTLAGIVADQQNNLSDAAQHFAQAARLAPQSAETRNNYGAILLKLKKPQAAAAEFAAALKITPQQRSALINLAQIRFAENNLPVARELFERAAALQLDAEIARALLVIALAAQDTPTALVKYQQYQSLVNTNATLAAPASRAELGASLLANGLYAAAVTELQAALATDAANVNNLVLLARAYLQQKDIRAAGRTLESALAQGLNDARLYAALADVYQAGGYVENAIPAWRLAIAQDPRNELYRVRYGLLLNDTSAPQAAILRLREAAQEFPNSARIYLALGVAQQADGKSAEAESSFRRVLELEPRSVAALAYLAALAAEQGKYDVALTLYERALGIEENNAVLHYLWAETTLKMPAPDAVQTERHLQRAIALDASLAGAYLLLGTQHARAAHWPEAATALEQAVKLAPENATAYYQLARALTRLKRTTEAQAALDKFKQLSAAANTQREATRQDLLRRLANTRF